MFGHDLKRGLAVGTIALAAATYGVMATAQAADTVRYSFAGGLNAPPDGSGPNGMIDVGGTFYGTTEGGGANCVGNIYNSGCGTVFETQPNGNGYKVLYSFAGGTTDGDQPIGGLIDVGGILYGTTSYGGAGTNCGGGSGCGTVFSLTPPTTGACTSLVNWCETVLWSFGSGSDGAVPYAGLTDVAGVLYGTTGGGGANQSGTIFALAPNTGQCISTTGWCETVPYSFGPLNSDPHFPATGLLNIGAWLYGTTYYGGTGPGCGSTNCGTVFKIHPNGTNLTVLHSFGGYPNDGSYPFLGGLTTGPAQNWLYGTTGQGGTSSGGGGTVFKIKKNGTGYTLLYSFSSIADGFYPIAGLLKIGNLLYGTTQEGGTSTNCTYGCGTVFSVNRNTGVHTVLNSFTGATTDGALPGDGSLINIGTTLYGTTTSGGTGSCSNGTEYGCGTMFSVP